MPFAWIKNTKESLEVPSTWTIDRVMVYVHRAHVQ